MSNFARAALLAAAALALLVFSAAGCRSSNAQGLTPAEITAVTYNVHFFSQGVAPIAANLKGEPADVVAMQEVLTAGGAIYSNQVAQHLGLQAIHSSPYVAYGNQGWVLSILTRFPVLERSETRLGTSRRALRVLLNVQGHRVYFVTMHLMPFTWNSTDPVAANERMKESRMREIQDLVDWMKPAQVPVVLLGDFNMITGWDEHDLLSDAGYSDADRGFFPTNHDTFPLDAPTKDKVATKVPSFLVPSGITLDYVFLRGSVEALDTVVIERPGSDHYPLAARLRLLP